MQLPLLYFLNLVINLIQMLQSRITQQTQDSAHLPRQEEWAIIYKHRALEMQKAKSLEKIISQQKKDSFKRQLDEQIISKNSLGIAEREEDRKYYEYISKKAQEMKEKEEREKFQKYIQRKHIQEQNQKHNEHTSPPQNQEGDRSYNLQIGLKSEIEKKQRAEIIRRDVVNTLDQQLQHKTQEKRKQKQQQIDQFNKNEAYLDQQFTDRGKQAKKYEQSQAVYSYYRDIYNQKMRKEKEIQHKLVDEAQHRKEEQELRKKESSFLEKERKNLEMKDTLQKQMQLINYRRNQEKSANPEQVTYSFIGNMFREKKAPCDKQQYSQFLEKQAEEHRVNKLQQQYMSEQEYKFNSNQLNKALNGNYTFEKYQDRSINTLGDRPNGIPSEPLRGDDADLVKTKLQSLRNRNHSMIHTRSEMDYSVL